MHRSKPIHITARYQFGFNGQLKDNEIYGEGNAYDFGARIYDPRTLRWFSRDPENQLILSPYLSSVNNSILFKDIEGRWIPGVDKTGRIFLTAEKGDNLETLYAFFGGKENASNYLPPAWTGNEQKGYIFLPNSRLTLSSSNPFTKAMRDAKDPVNERKYQEPSFGNRRPPENYNCHTAAMYGSMGVEFHSKTTMTEEERNTMLQENYTNVPLNAAIFGKTVITFGDFHSVNYFGKSQDGTIYAFSKQGPNIKPIIVPIKDLVQGGDENSPQLVGNGYVGNPTYLGGKTQYSNGIDPPDKGGRQKGNGGNGIKISNGTGYFNPKEKD